MQFFCHKHKLHIPNILVKMFTKIKNSWNLFTNIIELTIRWCLGKITNLLPVKVIRDDNGVPFLYRYHLFNLWTNGPGMCIHHFVKSDPDRGYHDHPWNRGLSFILAGGYEERILSKENLNENDKPQYTTYSRPRWSFNYLDGVNSFHRVMIPENRDAWTIFAFQSRSKTWGMISLENKYKPMSTTIADLDADWPQKVGKGLSLQEHLPLKGHVMATSDIVLLSDKKVLLIKRGKEPFKGLWAFPGGRIEPTDVDIMSCAKRELKEETNIADIDLKFFKTVGNNTRDPRGFCITNIFIGRLDNIISAKAGDDAVDYMWANVDDLPEMAFDHKDILQECLLAKVN
jgi:8-oxo-dGTP diphosphatase